MHCQWLLEEKKSFTFYKFLFWQLFWLLMLSSLLPLFSFALEFYCTCRSRRSSTLCRRTSWSRGHPPSSYDLVCGKEIKKKFYQCFCLVYCIRALIPNQGQGISSCWQGFLRRSANLSGCRSTYILLCKSVVNFLYFVEQ